MHPPRHKRIRWVRSGRAFTLLDAMANRLVTREGARTAAQAMRASRAALDRPLEGDAELSVVTITTPATVLGAFQRPQGIPRDLPLLRRASGGPFVRVGPGTLHVVLSLAHPSALVPCDAAHIVNRHVRPLLRALTKSGALAHYFGRDWVSVGHRPVGQVGFAHDSRTRRTAFEAFVALGFDFAPPGRSSFLGKEPTTLEEAAGRTIDRPALRARIVEAYATAAGRDTDRREFEEIGDEGDAVAEEPPWRVTAEEAIGTVGAGPDATGTLRLGGDLMASRDVIERVATCVAALPPGAGADEVGAIVDRELTAPGAALEGVRDLRSLRDVLARAR